jgi:hypothetical protein
MPYEPRKYIYRADIDLTLPARGYRERWYEYQARVKDYIELNKIVLPPTHTMVYREHDDDFHLHAPRDWAWYIYVRPNREPQGSLTDNEREVP